MLEGAHDVRREKTFRMQSFRIGEDAQVTASRNESRVLRSGNTQNEFQ